MNKELNYSLVKQILTYQKTSDLTLWCSSLVFTSEINFKFLKVKPKLALKLIKNKSFLNIISNDVYIVFLKKEDLNSFLKTSDFQLIFFVFLKNVYFSKSLLLQLNEYNITNLFSNITKMLSNNMYSVFHKTGCLKTLNLINKIQNGKS